MSTPSFSKDGSQLDLAKTTCDAQANCVGLVSDIGALIGISGYRVGPDILGTDYLNDLLIKTCPIDIPIGSIGDPHLTFAHGGHADYRGEHGQYFNFLSAANMSLNVRFKNASFNNGFQDVHGTYITEAHAVYRTIKGSFYNVSFHSDKLRSKFSYSGPKGVAKHPGFINSTCVPPVGDAFSEDQRVLLDIGDVELCDEAAAKVEEDGTLTLTLPEWVIRIKPNDVWHSNVVTTWSHKIDLALSSRVPEAAMKVKPHGIIGQSFDGDDVGVNGKLDPYSGAQPGPPLTTSAMAEGAIEGDAAEYKMASKFATEFKYSRFDRLSAPYRDVAALKGKKVKISAAQRSAGATNNLKGEVHSSVELFEKDA